MIRRSKSFGLPTRYSYPDPNPGLRQRLSQNAPKWQLSCRPTIKMPLRPTERHHCPLQGDLCVSYYLAHNNYLRLHSPSPALTTYTTYECVHRTTHTPFATVELLNICYHFDFGVEIHLDLSISETISFYRNTRRLHCESFWVGFSFNVFVSRSRVVGVLTLVICRANFRNGNGACGKSNKEEGEAEGEQETGIEFRDMKFHIVPQWERHNREFFASLPLPLL